MAGAHSAKINAPSRAPNISLGPSCLCVFLHHKCELCALAFGQLNGCSPPACVMEVRFFFMAKSLVVCYKMAWCPDLAAMSHQKTSLLRVGSFDILARVLELSPSSLYICVNYNNN